MTGPPRNRCAFLRWCLLALIMCASRPPLCAGETTGPPAYLFRLGFTNAMFVGINENDAKASIKALASTISSERGIPADPEPHLYDGTNEVAAALRLNQIDAIALTTDEYWLLRREFAFDGFLMAEQNGGSADSYLVITNSAARFDELEQLRNGRLEMVAGPHMSLARIWLDVELAHRHLPPSHEFFSRVTTQIKASRVVLAVFFRQVDVGIVTRQAFETMIELNPQIGKQVHVVAASLPYVPAFFAFSSAFPNPTKAHALHQLALLHTSPAGQQLLTIFQSERITENSESALRSALDLLDEYARLCPSASAAHAAALRGPAGNAKAAP